MGPKAVGVSFSVIKRVRSVWKGGVLTAHGGSAVKF
jgi:hypothetical protein